MAHLFVTGGCGFIGSALVRRAIAEGHQVTNFDLLTYAANPENLASVNSAPAYHFVQGDIRDPEAVSQALRQARPDVICHLAAETHVDRSIDGPMDFVTTNVNGTATLLQATRDYWTSLSGAAQDRFRFLHVSTDEVYGSLGETGAFTETSPYRPNSPYSASKASSDMLVRAWHETYGLPILISNCSNNYGPFQFPEKLIPVVILRASAGASIPVYGDGRNVRDWLHVDDHADALLTLLDLGRPGETYNVGGNAERSNLQLVQTLCSVLDAARPAAAPHADLIDFVTDRPGHDFRYAIDASKIRAETGWEPRRSLEESLSETVQWYLDNDAWCRGALARVKHGALPERLGR